MSEFLFHSISWEQIVGIWQNFSNAFIMTTSRLGLIYMSRAMRKRVLCHMRTELWSLIDVGISFPLNILRTNCWNLTKFFKCIYNDNIKAGINLYELSHEKTCLMSYANNKGADQPAHLRSLISAFLVHCQDRMIPLVYISKISSF